MRASKSSNKSGAAERLAERGERIMNYCKVISGL